MAEETPEWYKTHEKEVNFFFSEHLFLLDTDQDDSDFVPIRPIDTIKQLFKEYGAGLKYKDQWGCEAVYHGPTKDNKPHGFGINYQLFPENKQVCYG